MKSLVRKVQLKSNVVEGIKKENDKADRMKILSQVNFFSKQKVKKKQEMTPAEMEEFHKFVSENKALKGAPKWIIDALIRDIFDNQMQYEIFTNRCRDIGEPITMDRAKYFKDEINHLNQNPKNLIMCGMKLGVNSVTSLCKHAKLKHLDLINLADNSIADIGMHAIKNLISENSCIHLNLASNMISETGLEMILKDMTQNKTLRTLDIGVWANSIRKNSIGFEGAKIIAAILIHNDHLKSLKLQDNDIGFRGADIIAQALKQNKSLRVLKISQNKLNTEGAEFLIKSNFSLEDFDISYNNVTHKIGVTLQYFISNSYKLRKLNLSHNKLGVKGIEYVTAGLMDSKSLQKLDVSGNSLGDDGLRILLRAICDHTSLTDLRISYNDISPLGAADFIDVLPSTKLTKIDISQNIIEDESLIMLGDLYRNNIPLELTTIKLSSCRVNDVGFLYLIESVENASYLKTLDLSNNFISENSEKMLWDLIKRNDHMTTLELVGNRISLSCLSRVDKKLKQNHIQDGLKVPNRLKNEVYRLKFERKKVEDIQMETKKVESQIMQMQAHLENLEAEYERFKGQESHKREDTKKKILIQNNSITSRQAKLEELKKDYQSLQSRHEMQLDSLEDKNSELRIRRDEVKQEYDELKEEQKSIKEAEEAEMRSMVEEFNRLRNLKQEKEEFNNILLKKLEHLFEQEMMKKKAGLIK